MISRLGCGRLISGNLQQRNMKNMKLPTQFEPKDKGVAKKMKQPTHLEPEDKGVEKNENYETAHPP
jgi:hypothetical protein